MLVGLAMDARAMISALATDSSYAAYAANAGAWLALGLVVGALHFLSLRWTVRLFAEGHSVALAAATQLARFAVTAGDIGGRRARVRRNCACCRGAWHRHCAQRRRSPRSDRMIESPLATKIVFSIGPVDVTEPVVTTWCLMGALALAGWLLTRSLTMMPSRVQAAVELVVGTIEDQIRSTMRVPAEPYIPLIGTLFLFILAANWSSLIPGVEPPTAHIETDAALGLIVFFAIVYFGIRVRGVGGYLKTFATPTVLMVPLNLVETFTRTFSLIVRLFGNVMSGVFIIGIVLSLAGLLVPIPLMALELLVGAIQAYIFTVLAMVFIASALTEGANPKERPDPKERTA